MRIAALAGLFVLTLVATGSSKVSAEALGLLQLNNIGVEQPQTTILASLETMVTEPATAPPAVEPEIKKHAVAENDSLSTIAKQHETTWKRLFDKNETIAHPDIINIGDEIIIPTPEEVLPERPLPEPVEQPAVEPETTPRATARATRPARSSAPRTTTTVGSSSGNLYTPGYCTWYAKNRRPDLPNNLGNADTWVSRAAAQGLPTGSAPRVGAIGQQGMHVVYVESVNGDGTVTISEMNFEGLYVISSRTLSASNFRYIY